MSHLLRKYTNWTPRGHLIANTIVNTLLFAVLALFSYSMGYESGREDGRAIERSAMDCRGHESCAAE